jgi:hypothetical protein
VNERQYAILYVTLFGLMAFSLVLPLASAAEVVTARLGLPMPTNPVAVQTLAAACATAYVAAWHWVRGYFDAPYDDEEVV